MTIYRKKGWTGQGERVRIHRCSTFIYYEKKRILVMGDHFFTSNSTATIKRLATLSTGENGAQKEFSSHCRWECNLV